MGVFESVNTGRGKLVRETAPADLIVSVLEAKEHLRIDSTFTADDSYIQTLIEAASDDASNMTRSAMMTTDYQLNLDEFPDYFDLQLGQVTGVDTIRYFDTNNNLQTLASSEYDVDSIIQPGRVYKSKDGSWPSTYNKPNAVIVDFSAGWTDASEVPNAIKHAILMIVGHLYENRQDVSDRTYKQVPKGAEYLLGPYRIQEV